MFKNMTIKSRLILVISLLSILLVGIGGLGIYGLYKTNVSFKGVYEDRAVPLGELSLVVDRMQSIRLSAVISSFARKPEVVKEQQAAINQLDAEISAAWQRYLATNLTPIEKTLIESFNHEWKSYTEARNYTMAIASTGDFDLAIKNVADATSKFDAAHATAFRLLKLYPVSASWTK